MTVHYYPGPSKGHYADSSLGHNTIPSQCGITLLLICLALKTMDSAGLAFRSARPISYKGESTPLKWPSLKTI